MVSSPPSRTRRVSPTGEYLQRCRSFDGLLTTIGLRDKKRINSCWFEFSVRRASNMLTGTGKLFWHVVPLQGNKTQGYGGILVESSSPAGKKGGVITVTDPIQDKKLELEGIDLKVPHDGTPVEFTAGKVPNHEVYYAIRVARSAIMEVAAAVAKTGTINHVSASGSGRIRGDDGNRYFYDQRPGDTMGMRVAFDVDPENPDLAINVRDI